MIMKRTMKALVCRGPQDYSLETVDVGEPKTGKVKVKVLYAGVCGSDLSIARKFFNGIAFTAHE